MGPSHTMRDTLERFAQDQGIGLVLAVPCGPAAWGVPGAEAEAIQITALFTRPAAAYLGLAEPADVLRHEGPPAVLAWDTRRALRLVLRSNATVWSWLGSPGALIGESAALAALRALLARTLSRQALLGHALGEAKAAMNTYLPDDPKVAARAKYGLVIRPLMAAQWLLDDRDAPPADWASLRAGLTWTDEARALLDALEADALPERRVAALDAWIDSVFQAARDKGEALSPPRRVVLSSKRPRSRPFA
ncbi:nucleotidyltransferase domain-containing protein [Pararhodospirillum photometricum]|uniref:nucleotidyltransferase domain-containing protein n=1 Tax=Pararhodospirillum photometricum TaxID=1084 RepID=UPI0006843408|nr:nucleotidyltransferase domain-containing protein [Pararhodospirillum photometricum]